MRILVLGGTRFFGKILVTKLIGMGHKVTIGTRGQAKDDFGNKVERIVLDRTSKSSLEAALKDREFDIIYDNICFTSNEAKILLDIIKDKTKKYIVTSTVAVYDFNKNIKEEQFEPKDYKIVYGDRTDFTYGEGKRQVESVVFQDYSLLSIAVRFPVVLGKDDYTERLHSYVKKVINGESIDIGNMDNDFSFITADEAGSFLAFLSEADYEGPINGASNGSITLRNILQYIKEVSGKNPIISEDGESGAYNWMLDWSQDNSRATKLGFKFRNINDYIYDLVDYYYELTKK